jgi:hypothetical protein
MERKYELGVYGRYSAHSRAVYKYRALLNYTSLISVQLSNKDFGLHLRASPLVLGM